MDVCAKQPSVSAEGPGEERDSEAALKKKKNQHLFRLIKTYFYFICIRVSGLIRGHIQFGFEKNGGFLS